MVSDAQKARRALVAVLRRMVQLYCIAVALSFNSCDAEVLKAYLQNCCDKKGSSIW